MVSSTSLNLLDSNGRQILNLDKNCNLLMFNQSVKSHIWKLFWEDQEENLKMLVPIHSLQWWWNLKNFERDGTKKLLRGVTPSKTNWFWPICLLSIENFATFLIFIFLFFIFLFNFPFSLEFEGGSTH